MENFYIIKKQYIEDSIKTTPYTIFWVSLIIYSIGYLSYSSRIITEKLCIFLIAFGILGVAYSLFFLIKPRISNRYFRSIFIIYMISQLIILSQAFNEFTFTRFLLFITNPYIFFPYLIPIIILIPTNIFFLKRTFDYFALLALLLLVTLLAFRNFMFNVNTNFSEHVLWTFGTGGGFILLTWNYHNNKRRMLAILVVLLSLLTSTILARRNIMLTFSNYILFSIILLLFNSKQSITNKIFLILIVVSSFTGAYFLFNKYQDVLFARITERIEQNTRDQIFTGFFSSMSTQDLIYGKGFDGTYYAPTIEENDNRSIIECGYLQTILKGGIVNLALFLLIALPAAFLGIVKSNNTIAMAAGTIIILWLIDMFPWGMPALNIRYILVWICISICYSKEIRNLSEAEIKYSLKLFSK